MSPVTNRLNYTSKFIDHPNQPQIDEASKLLVLNQHQILTHRNSDAIHICLLSQSDLDQNLIHHLQARQALIPIGRLAQQDQTFAAIDFSLLSKQQQRALGKIVHQGHGQTDFLDLRQAYKIFTAQQLDLSITCLSLLNWHRQYQFCPRCGGKLAIKHTLLRICQACQTQHFPHLSPAVIMLVIQLQKRHCLLAHHHRLPTGTYSTLAGFVNPNETIEHTVKREVYEEVGLRISHSQYIHSQPWPFSNNSLMLGFLAYTHDTDIQIDDQELSDARWFDPEYLQSLRAHPHQYASSKDISLPRPDSIAYFLLETWLDKC